MTPDIWQSTRVNDLFVLSEVRGSSTLFRHVSGSAGRAANASRRSARWSSQLAWGAFAPDGRTGGGIRRRAHRKRPKFGRVERRVARLNDVRPWPLSIR